MRPPRTRTSAMAALGVATIACAVWILMTMQSTSRTASDDSVPRSVPILPIGSSQQATELAQAAHSQYWNTYVAGLFTDGALNHEGIRNLIDLVDPASTEEDFVEMRSRFGECRAELMRGFLDNANANGLTGTFHVESTTVAELEPLVWLVQTTVTAESENSPTGVAMTQSEMVITSNGIGAGFDQPASDRSACAALAAPSPEGDRLIGIWSWHEARSDNSFVDLDNSGVPAGVYTVGSDGEVTPGWYRLVSDRGIAGSAAQYESRDSFIAGNSLYRVNGQPEPGSIPISVSDGVIEISTYLVPIKDQPIDVVGDGISSGKYLIGVDVASGKYLVTAADDTKPFSATLVGQGSLLVTMAKGHSGQEPILLDITETAWAVILDNATLVSTGG